MFPSVFLLLIFVVIGGTCELVDIRGQLKPLPGNEQVGSCDVYLNSDLVTSSTPTGTFHFRTQLNEGLITVKQRFNNQLIKGNEGEKLKAWQYEPIVYQKHGQKPRYRRAVLDKQYPLLDGDQASLKLVDQMYSNELEMLPLTASVSFVFQPRESFSLLQMLKSPMVIMMLVTLVMLGGMSYLNPMEQLKQELQQQQNKKAQ